MHGERAAADASAASAAVCSGEISAGGTCGEVASPSARRGEQPGPGVGAPLGRTCTPIPPSSCVGGVPRRPSRKLHTSTGTCLRPSCIANSRRTSSGTYSGPSVGSGCVHSSTHSRRGREKHVQAMAHNARTRPTTSPRRTPRRASMVCNETVVEPALFLLQAEIPTTYFTSSYLFREFGHTNMPDVAVLSSVACL